MPASDKAQAPADAPRGVSRYVDLGVLSFLFVALAAWSWKKWPDVLVDFGKELYMAWQVAEGAVLYRDVSHFLGPFSVLFNAALFRSFGTSLDVVVFANLGWLAVACFAVHRIFSPVVGRLAVGVAAASFLVLFGFIQLLGIGNYNFVCPYTHEATHGLVLGILSILAWTRFAETERLSFVVLAGVAVGLSCLTRAEVAVPAVLAAIASVSIHRGGTSPGRIVPRFVAGLCLPILAAFLWFSRWFDARGAFWATFGAWKSLVTTSVTTTAFFKMGMGLDRPLESLVELLETTAVGAVALAIVWAADRALARRLASERRTHALLALVFVGVLALLLARFAAWHLVPRPLPLVCLAIGALHLRAWRRARADSGVVRRRAATMIVWSVFSIALLGKIVLAARIFHYGFYLAVPGVILAIVALVDDVPRMLGARRPLGGATFRVVVLAALAAFSCAALRRSNSFYAAKTFPVGDGGDRFFTAVSEDDDRARWVGELLATLGPRLRSEDTMVVVPEGVMINYLVRRRNPTPYSNFMQTEMVVYGEDAILASMQRSPPTWIAYVKKDTSEYGVGPFGEDPTYGKTIMDWVRREYVIDLRMGPPGETPDDEPIIVYRRKSS